MTVLEIANYLSKKGCILNGCSRAEIQKIENYYKVQLPETYVEFLKYMGKGAGKFMMGSSAFYDEIFDLKEGGIALLVENEFKPLPNLAFVFWMHQGYQFAFFNVNDGQNPPIYYYTEGSVQADFEKKENSFTDFLESQLQDSGIK